MEKSHKRDSSLERPDITTHLNVFPSSNHKRQHYNKAEIAQLLSPSVISKLLSNNTTLNLIDKHTVCLSRLLYAKTEAVRTNKNALKSKAPLIQISN
jgi:hypothetical protein